MGLEVSWRLPTGDELRALALFHLQTGGSRVLMRWPVTSHTQGWAAAAALADADLNSCSMQGRICTSNNTPY